MAVQPERHKTAYCGRDRVIPIGPRARALLEEFVGGKDALARFDPAAPVFSPKVAREERHAALRARRKSKVQPSQVSRKKADPKRVPRERYTARTYLHCVWRATAKAGVPRWHPNQLRHTFATQVRKAYGLEAVQVLLGHARMDVTQVYAEKSVALAVKVAGEIG